MACIRWVVLSTYPLGRAYMIGGLGWRASAGSCSARIRWVAHIGLVVVDGVHPLGRAQHVSTGSRINDWWWWMARILWVVLSTYPLGRAYRIGGVEMRASSGSCSARIHWVAQSPRCSRSSPGRTADSHWCKRRPLQTCEPDICTDTPRKGWRIIIINIVVLIDRALIIIIVIEM